MGSPVVLGAISIVLALGVSIVSWKLALALSLMACMGLLAFFKPGGLLIFLLWLLPFSVEVPIGSSKVTLPTEAIVPLLAFFVVLRTLIIGKVRFPRSRVYVPAIAFCGCMILTLKNVAPGLGVVAVKAILRDWVYFLGGFMLPILLIRTRRQLGSICRGALTASVVMALYGMFTQVREGVRMYQSIATPFFQAESTSIYGMYMAYALVLALGVALSERRKRLSLLAFYCPVIGAALVLSFSRGAWMGLVAAMSLYLWLFRARFPRFVVYLGALGLGVLVVFIPFTGLGSLLAERFSHFLDMKFTTNLDRLDRWHSAIAIWADHRILGSGWGTYGDMYFRYVYDPFTYASRFRMGAHNLFLEILADGGVVLLFAFLWLLGAYTVDWQRTLRRASANPFVRTILISAAGGIACFLVHAQVNNLGPSDKMSIIFWFLIALVPISTRFLEPADGDTVSTRHEP